jgi:hypothetical protein
MLNPKINEILKKNGFLPFLGAWLFGWTLFYPSMSPAIYFSKNRLKRSFFTPLCTKSKPSN